jgi:hypothetical protein
MQRGRGRGGVCATGEKKPRAVAGPFSFIASNDPVVRCQLPSEQRCGPPSTPRSARRVITSIYIFPAETFGAQAPASIARPACPSTRCVVPDSHNKFATVLPVPASIPEFSFVIRPRVPLLLRITVATTQTAVTKKSFTDRILEANCTHSKLKSDVVN